MPFWDDRRQYPTHTNRVLDTPVETKVIELHLSSANTSDKKTWNTGCFNKKLTIIAKDARLKVGIVSSTRVRFILWNRVMKNAAPARQLLRETGFFSMAEDLPNHVRAMQMVVSSGVPNSFFKNVFPTNLAPWHWVIYYGTLLQLLCVFVDCKNKEVRGRVCVFVTLSFTF